LHPFVDNFKQIFYMNGNQKMCLDIYAGSGPEVGFWPCKNAPGTNEDWTYSTQTGQIKSNFISNMCLSAGVQILVYTNGDEVALILNGHNIGFQNLKPFDSAVFSALFAPGNLTAVALKKGSVWAKTSVLSTGSPVAIMLDLEYPAIHGTIFSTGQDVALISAYVVDSSGLVVTTSKNVLTFTTTSNGRVVGTGNGDPSDHTADTGPIRAVWNGYARVIVGARQSAVAGSFTVTVTSPGLKSAKLDITTIPMAVNAL